MLRGDACVVILRISAMESRSIFSWRMPMAELAPYWSSANLIDDQHVAGTVGH